MRLPAAAVSTALGAVTPPPRRAWVAFSGGLDSTVLLYAAAACRGAGWQGELNAIHVHHGLQGQADRWAVQCRKVCGTLGIPLQVVAVDARAGAGESPEAAAREARYRALAALLETGDALLCAHQRDDQAETLLLQLLRGCGIAGLAAMPAVAPFGPGWLLRPLLAFARDDLLACATAHGLAWAEDPSNADLAFDRNYLRHAVLPILQARWPQVSASLARSAGHCAAALGTLRRAAAADLAALAGAGTPPASLPLAPLREWPAERTRHLLRHWLACLGFPAPGHRHLAQVESSLLAARPGRNPTVAWHGVELRRYRDRLHAVAAAAPPPPGEPVEWRPEQPLQLAHGVLSLQRVAGSGLASAAPLTVRYRLGGERLRPAGRQHTRSLKKLFQEAGIPPWCRARLPLLYRGDALVAVAGLWVAAEHAAAPGTRGWQPHWEEHALPGAVDHAD